MNEKKRSTKGGCYECIRSSILKSPNDRYTAQLKCELGRKLSDMPLEFISAEVVQDPDRMGDALCNLDLKPGEQGCKHDCECQGDTKCEFVQKRKVLGYWLPKVLGYCQAFEKQLPRDAPCANDKECMEGRCEENKCTSGLPGVQPEPETKCDAKQNPQTCDDCVQSKHVSGTHCAWCYTFTFDPTRGQCARSASQCPMNSMWYSSMGLPNNLGSLGRGGLTFESRSKVLPGNMSNPGKCAAPSGSRFFGLDVKQGSEFALKVIQKDFGKLDFYSRSIYKLYKKKRKQWFDRWPNTIASVTNFDPPEAFADHIDIGFAGLRVGKHDEDWAPESLFKELAMKTIANLPHRPWGYTGLLGHASPSYFNNWAPEGLDRGLRDAAVDAESEAFVQEYFGAFLTQTSLSGEWTTKTMLSDAGLTALFFDGPGAVLLKKAHKKAGRSLKAEKAQDDVAFVIDMSNLTKLEVDKQFLKYGCKVHFNANREVMEIFTDHTGWIVSDHYRSSLLEASSKGEKAKDSRAWEQAKFIVRASVLLELTVIHHLLWVHLHVSNLVSGAAHEKLGPKHTVRRLLKPFTFRANYVNVQASRTLFNEAGLVDRIWAIKHDSLVDYMESGSKIWTYQTVPDMIEATGVLLEDSPVLEDMDQLWRVFRKYSESYIDLYYKTDQSVQSEWNLSEYWEFIENGRSYRYGLPALAKESLKDQLAHTMFWVTGMHKLVGNVGDFYRLSARAFSPVIRKERLESDIQDVGQINLLTALTGLPQINLMNQWDHLYNLVEKTIMHQFQKDLAKMATGMELKYQKRARSGKFTTYYLNPRILDSSVAI